MSTTTQQEEHYTKTVAEIAAQTGFSTSAIVGWINTGQLPAKPISGVYHVNEQEALALASTKKKRRKKFFSYQSTT